MLAVHIAGDGYCDAYVKPEANTVCIPNEVCSRVSG